MSASYEDKLAALRCEIEMKGARVTVIDAAVSNLLATGSENLTGDLLLLLSDEAEHDEGMFSLIHAAESTDDSTYVRAFLSVFPQLMQSAPRWASIVLMRLLNNEATQSEMVKQLHDASGLVKESVREMCERINKISPQFLNKTIPVTVAAGK